MEQDDFKTILEEKEKVIHDLKAKLATTESEKARLLQHMTHFFSKWKEETSEMEKLLSKMESSTGFDHEPWPVRRQKSMGLPPLSFDHEPWPVRRQKSMGVPPDMAEESPEAPSASHVVPELRVVLLGGSSVEQQAVTEAILSRGAGVQVTTSMQTECSESRQEEVFGRMVRVVNTPDWFSREFVEMQDVRRCMSLCSPGPHVFIIIIPVKSIGEKERNIQEKMDEMFGETCWKHTMVLLTSEEEVVEQTSMEELLQRGKQELSQLIERCGNRCHLFSLKTSAADVTLLEEIEGVISNNIDEFYCSQTYFEAEEHLREMAEAMAAKMQRDKEQRKEMRQSIKKEKEDQFKKMLQESLSGMERDISKHESDMKTISERLSELERSRKEEQNQRKVKEIERNLKRETAAREAVEKRINELKEKWEKERIKMEEKHKKDIEEIQDNHRREARVETEKHFRKLLLSGFHKKINTTKPMIQQNLNAVAEG